MLLLAAAEDSVHNGDSNGHPEEAVEAAKTEEPPKTEEDPKPDEDAKMEEPEEKEEDAKPAEVEEEVAEKKVSSLF